MLPHIELFSRLLLASLLGSIIGLERERRLWAAGLRTHMLVCVGSCLIMIVSTYGFFDILGTANIILDPSRIAAQVVSGIGFLGAGAILLRGDIIRGLTTAASIWAVAGIGLAVGAGLYLAACFTTILIIIILVAIKPLGIKFKEITTHPHILNLTVKHGEMTMDLIQQTINERSRYIKQFIVEPSKEANRDHVTITLSRVNELTAFEIMEELKKLPCVEEITEDPCFKIN
jgi:putative Mg2+ transporter-C (MgtC) family protein